MRMAIMDFQNLPIICFTKDKQNKFVDITHAAARLMGWPNAEQAIGKTSADMPCKAAELFEHYSQIDNIAITQKTPILTLGFLCLANDKWHLILGERTPLYNSNKVIQNTFIDVTHFNQFYNLIFFLQCNKKNSSNEPQAVTYILDNKSPELGLSERQQECLFYLLHGFSVKLVAQHMKISPRTVEIHIRQIKVRLKCTSKDELIEKALGLGLSYHIPSAIQRKYITPSTIGSSLMWPSVSQPTPAVAMA